MVRDLRSLITLRRPLRPHLEYSGHMTHHVGIRDFRENLGDWLARIEAGDTVTITRHGRPVARLTGAEGTDSLSRALTHPRIRGLQPGHFQLPAPVRLSGDKTLSDYVSEGRR